jgi:hypothetical protein
MADATGVVNIRGTQQFQGAFSEMWEVVATINADNLADGAGDNDAVAVPGVALGDMILGVSLGVDLAGLVVTAYVSAANVVTVRFQNESAAAVDLASTTIRILIGRPAW